MLSARLTESCPDNTLKLAVSVWLIQSSRVCPGGRVGLTLSAIAKLLVSLLLMRGSLRTPSIFASLTNGLSATTGCPTSCSKTPFFTTRSAWATISCELAKSRAACAVLTSTMVARPASNLAWAISSCCLIKDFLLRYKATLS